VAAEERISSTVGALKPGVKSRRVRRSRSIGQGSIALSVAFMEADHHLASLATNRCASTGRAGAGSFEVRHVAPRTNGGGG
jgi:hypothetical protein